VFPNHAKRAIATIETKCEAKYPKAAHWRTLDTDTLLAFYDFGAEHWVQLRTSNAEWPGESHLALTDSGRDSLLSSSRQGRVHL